MNGVSLGIATQSVVERVLLKEEGKSRHDLGREQFIKKVWEWKEKYGNTITDQFRCSLFARPSCSCSSLRGSSPCLKPSGLLVTIIGLRRCAQDQAARCTELFFCLGLPWPLFRIRRVGSSVSWQHFSFTLDKKLSTAVVEAFVRLFNRGLIYREQR